MCLNHECEKCGKKLYENTRKDKLITLIIMLLAWSFVVGSIFLLENSTSKDCYERHYISGRGTDLEVLKNVDVDCPK